MTIKKFSQYLVEDTREVFFTLGRMNPPTKGHGRVLDELSRLSGKNDYRVYLTQSHDPIKNPLTYSDKVKHTRKMFPKHGRNIMVDREVKDVLDIGSKLFEQGYNRITMVVGSDRVTELKTLLEKYNGKETDHGYFNFESIRVVSAGDRCPDLTDIRGVSASKQRTLAENNNYTEFCHGIPGELSDKDTRKLFNDVRKGMGLTEEMSFKNHINLGKLSETREKYVSGELFELGDSVVIKESDEVCKVVVLGSNYVILEKNDGSKVRKWLDSVEKVEEKTLTTDEKKKKEEIAKAIDRENPDMDKSKKIAIATSKAKEVSEQDAVSAAREKINREKASDRKKHDKILDRARIVRARRKARSSKEYRG